MRHSSFRIALSKFALLFALLVAPIAPIDRALARDDHENTGAKPEHGAEQGHEGHGGPLHLGDILRSTEFWGAVINFSLLVFVLRRFGAKPLREFLVSRRSEMQREMAAAAELKAKAEAKYQEYTQRLSQLDGELAKLRKDIERAAQEDKQRILADAEESARRLRRETESLIDQHAKALSASIRNEVVAAAMAQAEQLLRQSIVETDQQRLAQRFVQAISHDGDAPAHAERAPARAIPQEQA